MITSWDPGKTTGWVAWSDTGELLELGECDLEKITETWYELEAKHGKTSIIVVEDFRLFKKRAVAQVNSNMPASQGIGMLKALAAIPSTPPVEVVIQAPNIKPMAKKLSQVHVPSNHDDTHTVDAYMHGFYYLHGKGLVKTPLQIQKEAERNDS